MKLRWWFIVLPFILLTLPIILRYWVLPSSSSSNNEELEDKLVQATLPLDQLVIITPHPETIRYEFDIAFRRYYLQQKQRRVHIYWLSPGGTADITRFIEDRFQIAFKQEWLSHPEWGPWTSTIAEAFANPKIRIDDSSIPEIQRLARWRYLDSNVSIGVDLFFGGGQYPMHRLAERGHAVDAGLIRKHPEWFIPKIIPQTFSGEIIYDSQGRYYGVCLSTFGICYNPQWLQRLGISEPPRTWEDLAHPIYFDHLILGDPTKSGSINKCFEMILQERMQFFASSSSNPSLAMENGWYHGINLLRRLAGNSREITVSAGKITREVAEGNAAVGVCIDFYGRTESEWSTFQTGREPRIYFHLPQNGSSVSADPIQLLRGAPNRDIAIMFMEFVLSPEGQSLWNYKPKSSPWAPQLYALRRMPVRQDLYSPQHDPFRSDPGVNPYQQVGTFQYQAKWTAPYFNLLRILFAAMAIDAREELKMAWKAIIDAGGPTQVPLAYQTFCELPFSYNQASEINQYLFKTPMDTIRIRREWCNQFRNQYRKAYHLAKEKK